MFNIQVDNPVSILNQDTARTFLNSSEPSDKYKLFMKGTQLEQIEAEYKSVAFHRISAKNTLQSRKEVSRIVSSFFMVYVEVYVLLM